ncbi:MAG: tetratricopeptide repeat protein [Alphaproteobacteria bacterium]
MAGTLAATAVGQQAAGPAASADALLRQGVAALRNGQYDVAETLLRKALVGSGERLALAHLYLGYALLGLKRPDEAAIEIEAAQGVGLSPDTAEGARLALAAARQQAASAQGAAPAAAAGRWLADASMRLESVDGIAVPIDLTTALDPAREADMRASAAFSLGFRAPVAQDLSGAATLAASDTRYRRRSDLDVATLTPDLRLEWSPAPDLLVASGGGMTHMWLNEAPYLDVFRAGGAIYQRHTPEVVGNFGLTVALSDFRTSSGLDATTVSLAAGETWSVIPDELQMTIRLGYDDSNARSPTYSHARTSLAVVLSETFTQGHTVAGQLAFSRTRYRGPDTIEVDRYRLDETYSGGLSYAAALSSDVSVDAALGYSHTDSSLRRQAYSSTTLGVGIRIRN